MGPSHPRPQNAQGSEWSSVNPCGDSRCSRGRHHTLDPIRRLSLVPTSKQASLKQLGAQTHTLHEAVVTDTGRIENVERENLAATRPASGGEAVPVSAQRADL